MTSEAPQTEDTTATPNLDWLREEVRKLSALLDDPHPGLGSWNACLATRMNAIVSFWEGGDAWI